MSTRATPRPGARRGGRVDPARRAAAPDRDASLRRHAAPLRTGDGMGARRGCRACCREIVRLCELGPERTIFTRFIPARRPGEGQGTWRRYYRRWASMTLEAIGADMVELMPELARYVPPAETIDKPVYSPWWGRRPASTASCPGLRRAGRQRRRDRHVRAGHDPRRSRPRLSHRARAGRGLQQLGRKPRFRCSSSSATAMASTVEVGTARGCRVWRA